MTDVLSQALGVGNVQIKGSDEDEDDGTEPLPAKGKVGIYHPNPSTDKNERIKAHIDKCYDTLANPKASQSAKDKANKEITQMIGEAVRGWKASGQIGRLSVSMCVKCGNVMEGDECATCGWVRPVNQR